MAQINWYNSLVVITYDHPPNIDEYQQELQHWDTWLEKNDPFCVMRVFASDSAMNPPPEAAALAKKWRDKQLPMIQQKVRAMAIVFCNPPTFDRTKNLQVEKLFGIPGGVFINHHNALGWLQHHCGNQGLILPEVIHAPCPRY